MKKITSIIALFIFCAFSYGEDIETNISQHLQDISVTIKAGTSGRTSQGSGVIITREMKMNEDSENKIKINFVWTAAHVVDSLRGTREVVDPKSGQKKTVVQFKDASIVKELTERGRRVGELKMDAKVIKYSDADNGEDLALLMVRKRNFIDASANFYCEESIVPVGTKLYHVGSLLGQLGSNSMTSGIMSQVGRVVVLGGGDGTVFDQTTVPAFPGSSGGGVFLTEDAGEHQAKYCGMLVRGAGETFNLIVPIRRMRVWAEKANVNWALDASEKPPTIEKLLKQPVEDIGVEFSGSGATGKETKPGLGFLIVVEEKNKPPKFIGEK